MADKNTQSASTEAEISIERMFLASEVIPNAAESFLSPSRSLSHARDQADVVLDTSALLIPYGSGADSLETIMTLYRKLSSSGRLFIPAQAAREFVRNRPRKISELQQALLDKMSTFAVPEVLSSPILGGLPEYTEIATLLKQADSLRKDLKKAANALVEVIRGWEWNDPVSSAYKGVITPGVIIDCGSTHEDLRREMLRRYELAIPPGYKDSSKADGGIGDFLIWKTILQIGIKNQKPLIFVSGDEKADWQHSSKGVAFLPRFELVEEYRQHSGGQPFYIIPLSKLLELFEGESASVVELQIAEERLSEEDLTVGCPDCGSPIRTRLERASGSSATPWCVICSKKFHVNRRREGVIVRRANHPAPPSVAIPQNIEVSEIAFCPSCRDLVEFPLGTNVGSAHWVTCTSCNAEFPTRRLKDGLISVSTTFSVPEATAETT